MQSDEGADLMPEAVATRLRSKHKHRIMALVDELDRHLEALDLARTPNDVRVTCSLLHTTDPTGEAFRYPGELPAGVGDTQDNIDFTALRDALRSGFDSLGGASSMLEETHQHLLAMTADMPDYVAEMKAEYRAELEAEMRAEIAAEYGP